MHYLSKDITFTYIYYVNCSKFSYFVLDGMVEYLNCIGDIHMIKLKKRSVIFVLAFILVSINVEPPSWGRSGVVILVPSEWQIWFFKMFGEFEGEEDIEYLNRFESMVLK